MPARTSQRCFALFLFTIESITTPTVDRIRVAIDADYARSLNARGTIAFVVYDKGFLSVLGDAPSLHFRSQGRCLYPHDRLR
jgi:hypothetical protein